MEKIKEIKKIYNLTINNRGLKTTYDGFCIETDKGSIKILIENCQNCCENFGYATCEDDLDYFIGAEVLNVSIVSDEDGNIKTRYIESGIKIPFDYTMFVNVETTKGTIQFAVYNAHNGYYGHRVSIIWNDDTVKDTVL
jgi:hypothetical protein